MTNHIPDARQKVRKDFEAWAKQAGWPHHATMPINKGPDYFSDMSLAVWQAATQRSAERIAELEAQVKALREANNTFATNAIAKDAT